VYRAERTQNAESLRGFPGYLRVLGEDRLDGEVTRRNDRVRSGVTIEAVEGVLIRANQNDLGGG